MGSDYYTKACSSLESLTITILFQTVKGFTFDKLFKMCDYTKHIKTLCL